MERWTGDGEVWRPEQQREEEHTPRAATNERNQRGREDTVFATVHVFNTRIYALKMPTVEANPSFHKPCSDA